MSSCISVCVLTWKIKIVVVAGRHRLLLYSIYIRLQMSLNYRISTPMYQYIIFLLNCMVPVRSTLVRFTDRRKTAGIQEYYLYCVE